MLLIALLAALVPAAIPAYDAQAQSEIIEVEIQPDGANMNDAHIVSTAATTNYGSSTELGVGESNAGSSVYRSLLEFDLTGLPYDMNVIAATLTLTVDQDLSDGGTMCAYALKVDWVEGQVKWNQRKNISVAWQTAGASGANDRELEDAVGCVELGAGLEAGQTVELVLSPNDVEAMRKDNYFGFLLKMEDEADDLYIFRSSDHATETDRPKIELSYDPDTPLVDPGWTCEDGALFGYTFQNCSTHALISPFTSSGGHVQAPGNFGTGIGMTAGLLHCEPYPRCVNDYPIYYRLEWSANFRVNFHTGDMTLNQWLSIPGMSNHTLGSTYCPQTGTVGGKAIGDCMGYYEGVILPSQLPENSSQPYTIGLVVNRSGLSFMEEVGYGWNLYLSLSPFDQDCADEWYVPLPETFVIDPLIETPLGIYGEPADDQIYETVIGQTYMVRVLDGPWDDGVSNDRTDAAVSLDGENWMTWTEFSAYAFCVDVIPELMDNLDYQIMYFEATTEEFHIRVNDIEDEFDDNDNHNETPFSYAIGIAFSLAGPVECESQFTWDDVNDWIASVNVIATEEDVPALTEFNEPMIAGEWYAIEVASGTWNESGGGAPRVDMEFLFTYVMGWEDLAEGSNLVYCVSADGLTVFIQAPNNETLDLHLRVNDQDEPQNWADNAGALGVNIYRVTFTRTITGCELQFDVGNFVVHDTVEGTAANGKQFANVFSSGGVSYSYGLTPGGWYMLETTDGPWWRTFTGGGYESNTHYYDMQLQAGGTWYDFDEWPFAECVVTVDALGHQRVYFQAPDEGGMQYFIRIAGAGPFTRGWMGWNLYQAIDLDLTGLDECSDFTYNPESTLAIGSIDSWLSGGNLINGLANDAYFAIHIESANTDSDPPYYQHSGWWESSSSEEERDDLQLTIDGGANWQTLPNHPAVLCYYYTPGENELVFFVRVLNGQSWKMRAESETFSNNIGSVIYRVHQASAGELDPWSSCMDDYTATVPALNEHEWIPPQDEEGILISPTLTYTSSQDPDGDGIIHWGAPGLVSGKTYMIATKNGPWYDGESPTPSYLAQLSSDDGENWYSFGEHPDVICYKREQTRRYWTAIFSVETGQRWRIRVADTESSVFTDNTGNLAYKLNLVNEFPVNGPGDYVDDYDPGAFDVCTQALVRPQSLTLSEIGSLGNYFGDWIQYINRSLLSYFAWCPQHTEMLVSAMRLLQTKEPLATISALNTVAKNVAADVASYDWDGGFEDTSIFTNNATDLAERLLPRGGVAVSPWEEGGDLVHFDGGNNALPSFYYTCDNVFTDYLPSRIRTGVCFTSAYWKETGASFWVQLSLDISAIFMLFLMIKSAVQSLVYMMTGIRPWTKDGAQRMIIDVANGSDLIQPVDQWRSPNYRRRR